MVLPAFAPEALRAALSPHLDRLLTPALVIDLEAVERNADALLARAGERWRPHVKTLKQSVLIRLLLARGVGQLKCATVDELRLSLEVARDLGRERIDVLLAWAPRAAALRAVLGLRRRHPGANVTVLADSPEHLSALGRAPGPRPLEVLLDVDTGMGRTGSSPEIWRAAAEAPPGVRVAGLHAYEGHLARDARVEAFAGYDAVCALAQSLGLDELLLVTSGSASFLHALAHPGLASAGRRHQVSPGTLVLCDLATSAAAAELSLRQAVFVASRVVSRPAGDRVTLDAGTKAISPDRFPSCAVAGHPGLEPLQPSEEHLVLRAAGQALDPGELLFLVPAHACTTVNLHRRALLVRGGRLVGESPVEAAAHGTWVED